jgi:thymidylate synthase (FAD)
MNNTRIVALTQPIISTNGNVGTDAPLMAVDEFVAYVARVSNPSNQTNTLTANKLLKYLAKHKHWSPFEMVHVVMEINTTRDIARQILRHRSFSFQEFSQRYADPTGDLGFSHREARLQDTKNRQNSVEVNDPELQRAWDNKQAKVTGSAMEAYTWAINNGIAKEQARAVLPEGLTNSRMYMAGSLRSWIHYCQLRMGVETQKEHREIATDAWYQITAKFPSLRDSLDIGC